MTQVLPIFFAVFLAELGDKTQLATLLFASDRQASPWIVFLAAAGALIATTAIAVVAGNVAGRLLQTTPLKLIAVIGFVLIGAWTIWGHFYTSTSALRGYDGLMVSCA